MAVRRETLYPSEINFSIVEVIDSTNRQDGIYSDISSELSNFKDDNIQQTVQKISKSDTCRETTSRGPNRPRREHTSNGRVSKKPIFLSG